ncbi:hypothetical protein RSAG8_09979, partial [Rhizoctonia solani AG-8 WAC10335]
MKLMFGDQLLMQGAQGCNRHPEWTSDQTLFPCTSQILLTITLPATVGTLPARMCFTHLEGLEYLYQSLHRSIYLTPCTFSKPEKVPDSSN